MTSILARYLLASLAGTAFCLFCLALAVSVSHLFLLGTFSGGCRDVRYIASIACPACGRSVMMRYRPVLLWWPLAAAHIAATISTKEARRLPRTVISGRAMNFAF